MATEIRKYKYLRRRQEKLEEMNLKALRPCTLNMATSAAAMAAMNGSGGMGTGGSSLFASASNLGTSSTDPINGTGSSWPSCWVNPAAAAAFSAFSLAQSVLHFPSTYYKGLFFILSFFFQRHICPTRSCYFCFWHSSFICFFPIRHVSHKF
jgi:hypothetical protein